MSCLTVVSAQVGYLKLDLDKKRQGLTLVQPAIVRIGDPPELYII